jgi:glycosyltransferase involved in cell wall biosynthesis
VKHINLYGPVNQLGYGIHFSNWAGNLIPLLRQNGVSVGVFPMEMPRIAEGQHLPPHMIALFQAAASNAFDPKSPSVNLWTLNDVARYGGNPRCHYTVFEGTILNQLQAANARKVDHVFVPTHWHKECLARQEISSSVIPEGVDPELFSFGDTGVRTDFSRLEDPDEMLTFVSVGKFEKRKGMEAILPALVRAHQATNRPMRVLAHWYSMFLPFRRVWWELPAAFMAGHYFVPAESDVEASAEGRKTLRFTHQHAPNLHVDLILAPMSQQEQLVTVYRTGDFGLFPHYAEGWGLPLHESMACGLPPITQHYSGPTEYLEQGCFIPLVGTDALAKDGNPEKGVPSFFRGDVGTWRQVTIDSLAQAMITACEMSKDTRKALGRKASDAALKFTWKHSAEISMKVFKDLEIL